MDLKNLVGKFFMKISNFKMGKLFSIIRLGYLLNHDYIILPVSKYYLNILKVLFSKNFILGFFLFYDNNSFLKAKIYLKYFFERPFFNFIVYNLLKYFFFIRIKFKFFKGIDYGFMLFTTSLGLIFLEDCLINKITGKFLFHLK